MNTALALVSSQELTTEEGRAQITAMIASIRELPIHQQITKAQSDEGLVHHFAPGVYARELLLPAGSTVVGKIHKTEHLNIICSGKCIVASSEGAEVLEGPIVFSSGIGIQKAVHSLTDVVWVTIHVTEETDLEVIEDETIAKDYNEIPLLENT